MTTEIILVSVSGRDRPGITAALSTVLARFDTGVLDIGQAVIHDHLSWGMLIEVPAEHHTSPLLKELLFEAHALELDIRFTPVSASDYERWVSGKGMPRHIITLLARRITAAHIAWISELTTRHGLNIDLIQRLSGRVSLATPDEQRHAAIELWLRGEVADPSEMHAAFLRGSQEMDADVAIQEDSFYRRNRRLVCFDMDSTLVQAEVIDELADAAGVREEVSRITRSAMCGEMDFKEGFRRRVALLEGLREETLERVAHTLVITQGAQRLISTLKRYGYKIAILSGGFTYFARHLQAKLGIDHVHANELEIRDGKLTGRVRGPIVDEHRKAELLRSIAEREGARLEQVIAVGDGANDLPMLSIAGLGIAFRAKPLVKRKARYALQTSGLDAILYLLGMRERDFAES